MKTPRSRLALLLFPASLAFSVLLSTSAFAQVVVTPPVITTGAVSATTIIIASLAILVGYVTQGIQSGSLFGVIMIPKPWLPYLGLLGGFLGAFTPSITNAAVKNEAAWLTALFAGLIGLGGIVAGVTAKQHVDAHLRDRTPVVGSGAGGVKVDAVTQAANEVTPATGTPLKRDWSALLPRRTPLALALACGLLAVGASTGANCNGTVSPQTQAEIQAALVLGDCIESVYAADSAKVPAVTPVQIAIDEGATCGADVANLVTLFGSSPVAGKVAVAQAAQANAAQVHAAALTHQGH